MVVLRNKSFSEKKKDYKNEIAHGTGALINGAIASQMTKHVIKGKGHKKLAGIGAIVAAGNTGYHAYKAADGIEKKRKNNKE